MAARLGHVVMKTPEDPAYHLFWRVTTVVKTCRLKHNIAEARVMSPMLDTTRFELLLQTYELQLLLFEQGC